MMDKKTVINRIQRFGLTCNIETDYGMKHFHNGHEYVEIGGLKWATMNVGANSISDRGLYFQWGDTQGYTEDEIMNGEKHFKWNDYKFYHFENGGYFTKYNDIDKKTVLDAKDDAVTAAWGKGWRMPTKEEFMTLYNTVKTSWVINYKGSGTNGLLCSDMKDSTKVLFLPCCGFASCQNIFKTCDIGYYWSSDLFKDDINVAFTLTFNTFGNIVHSISNVICSRQLGFQIRGILDV